MLFELPVVFRKESAFRGTHLGVGRTSDTGKAQRSLQDVPPLGPTLGGAANPELATTSKWQSQGSNPAAWELLALATLSAIRSECLWSWATQHREEYISGQWRGVPAPPPPCWAAPK